MTDILPEIFVETGGAVGIDNLDDLMEAFPGMAKRAVNSALASEGYRLKEILQIAISSGGPSGAKWEPKSAYHFRLMKQNRNRWWRMSSKTKTRRSSSFAGVKKTGGALAKFIGGIRYQVDKDLNTMSVGFVNASAGFEKMLSMAERGFETPVTARMRRYFFSLGLPLSPAKTALKSPARPLIGPVFEAEEQNISANLELKFFANMDRYMNEGTAS